MLYCSDMNIKRGRDLLHIKLNSLNITNRDLINLEKIILKRIKPTDFTVIIGKPKGLYGRGAVIFSSARYIPDETIVYRYAELRAKAPNLSVRITPRSSEIVLQRIYQKGEDLKMQYEIASELEKYLVSIK